MTSRLIAALLMSFGLSLLMSGWVTLINLGWTVSYFDHWTAAWLKSWPIAAICAFLLGPSVHKLTVAIVSRFSRQLER